MTDTETDEDMICGLTAGERELLCDGLRGLPQTVPPRAVWERIREQAEAEGLFSCPASGRPSTWFTAAGLAAALALAVIGVQRSDAPEPGARTVPAVAEQTSQRPLNALQALMVESRRLENDLHSLPAEPRVMRAGTVASISGIEDRIAAIDYQLSDPAVAMTGAEQELFWRERVRLMKSLVQLRYAQAQRTAF